MGTNVLRTKLITKNKQTHARSLKAAVNAGTSLCRYKKRYFTENTRRNKKLDVKSKN